MRILLGMVMGMTGAVMTMMNAVVVRIGCGFRAPHVSTTCQEDPVTKRLWNISLPSADITYFNRICNYTAFGIIIMALLTHAMLPYVIKCYNLRHCHV